MCVYKMQGGANSKGRNSIKTPQAVWTGSNSAAPNPCKLLGFFIIFSATFEMHLHKSPFIFNQSASAYYVLYVGLYVK